MTIIYQYRIATASLFGFPKLLACWKGSVYKLMFKETLIFGGIYSAISLIYRLALNPDQQRVFEKLVRYCNSYTSLIPVSFVLGFYVSIVVHRWWQQFTNVPWPDRTLFLMGTYLHGRDEQWRIARRTVARYMMFGLILILANQNTTLFLMGTYLHGRDEQGRIARRTVARYMMFGLILILRSISVAVMKRYPTIDHIVDAGFITSEEAVEYDNVSCKYNKFWVPLLWANTVLTRARTDGRVQSDIGFQLVMEQLADFRDKCSLCFVYDWITIPLVYTQVVTLAVYMFFGACLVGRQYVAGSPDHPDFYFPFFTVLQFFFYMGWLKVAEQLLNPFGEDDDDFDMNWLIDRHTAVSMCLVDHCHGYAPPLVKDAHFNEIIEDLPYTEGSMASRRPNFLGSTYNLVRPSVAEQKVIPPSNLLDVPQVQGSRLRSHTTAGTLGGSMWSLFGMKPNLRKAPTSDSRDTLKSSSTVVNGYGPTGFHANISYSPVPQRRNEHHLEAAPSHLLNPDDLPPEYVPLRRARASTVADHKPLQRVCDADDADRQRKWSFPLSLLRRKQEKDVSERLSMYSDNLSISSFEAKLGGDSQPLLDVPQSQHQVTRPPTSRFTVEPVGGGDQDVDASKHTRNKQIIDKHIGHMSVSRPPVLSAIEEGNTIRSLKDLVPSAASSLEQLHVDRPPDTVIDAIPTTIEEEMMHDNVFYEDSETVFIGDDLDSDEEDPIIEQQQEAEKTGLVRRKSSSVWPPTFTIPDIVIEEF